MRCSKFGGNFGGGAASVSRRENLVEEKSLSLFFAPFKFLPPLLARAGGFDAKIFSELNVRLHLHYGPLIVLNNTKGRGSGYTDPEIRRGTVSVWSKRDQGEKGGGGPSLDPALILSAQDDITYSDRTYLSLSCSSFSICCASFAFSLREVIC